MLERGAIGANRLFAEDKGVTVLVKLKGDIERKATDLINDVLKFCRKNDVAVALPQPVGSKHNSLQYLVTAFVAITKLLVIVIRKEFSGTDDK